MVRPAASVVIISPDGLDYIRFWQMIDEGRLPNIRRLFVDGGVTISPVVNTLPSVTYANYSALLTGQFPGHHDIVNNLWFERSSLTSQDYMTLSTYLEVNGQMHAPTMYEMLSDHVTFNIQCHTRRGATYTSDNRTLFATAWILGLYSLADLHVPDDLAEVNKIANSIQRWPSIITTYFPAVDELGHRHGPDSTLYGRSIQDMDRTVQRIYNSICEGGLADITYFMLVTDHGMPPIDSNRSMDLSDWLRRERKLNIYTKRVVGKDYQARFKKIEPYDIFLIIGADRCAQIHMRGEQGWAQGPSAQEVERFIHAEPSLTSLAAVDCVVTQPAIDQVQVYSSRGTALIERRRVEGRKQYRLAFEKDDCLGYSEDASLREFVAQGWHDSHAWLRATIETQRPDFVPQVMEMFDSPRTGNVVLFAAEGANFTKAYEGGHGSCLARDMRIVWQVAGPNAPAGGVVKNARLVDVAPTVLGLLGEASRLEKFPAIDGVNLSEAIRNAPAMPRPTSRPE